AATAAQMAQEIRDAAAPHREAAAKAGMTVATKPGPGKGTWTGWTDEQLMKEVKIDRWYDLYYRHFSSGVHVDASTTGEDINALARGERAVGPRYRDPFGAIRVATEVLHGTLLAYHKHFGVGDLRIIDQAKSAIDRELSPYQRIAPAP
nr:hypothetical protein [Candidatus Dormibacteraeota bacterium]